MVNAKKMFIFTANFPKLQKEMIKNNNLNFSTRLNYVIGLSILVFAIGFLACSNKASSSETIIQWRGIDRTGIFHETGLMTSWPEEGPSLLWYFDGLGEGHSSPAIANNTIFVTGMIDENGYLFAFDLNGNLLHQVSYGVEWNRNFHGTRGTPTISDGKIYLTSGMGILYCFDLHSLDLIWEKDLLTTFGGTNLRWGFTESPLVVDNKVIVTPGGEQYNVVALNKKTGELIWSTPGMGDTSAYCSAIYINTHDIPLVITLTSRHIIGIDARNGQLIWSYESRNTHGIKSNTPLYHEGMLMWTAVDKGATMLRLLDGGRNVELVWHIPYLDNMMGGYVKMGNYLYASSSGERSSPFPSRDWFCVNWYTGEIKWRAQDIDIGAIIANDGLLYIYSHRGEMALVRPNPERMEVISQFPITLGTGTHWAHPIIYKGVLYIRHGDTLMAFDIKK